jgi:acid phosphatase family membrane protein YuiD
MQYITQIVTNKYLYIPVLTWFSIQLFKVIWDLVKEKRFNFKRIMGAGGMPSSHSAVVCALSVLVGKSLGFDSAYFALATIFAFVVMYDACGVRRAAGKQASLLNKIISTPGLTNGQVHERLVEVLGHTPVQVLVGAIIGIIVGAIF